MAEHSLWLFIEFPCLALEAWFGPEAPHQTPRLLLAGNSQTVLQCNPSAEALGVRTGMSTSTAYCLLDQADIAHYDAQLEREQLGRLALVLYRLCADIRLCPPSGVLLEVGSMLKLFGGLPPFLQQVQAQLRQTGYRYHCATGHTALAARLLAQNHIGLLSQNPEEVRARLDPLPIDALDLPIKDTARITRMGLTCYAQLRRAPRSELGYRFGPEMVRHLNALEQPETLGHRFVLPPHFNERLELLHEATEANGLLFPVRRLLVALEAYLQARQQCIESLHLKLEHRELPPTRLHVQAVRGAKTAQEWQHLTALALERQPLPAPVIAVRLRAHRFQQDTGRAGDLLGTAYPEADADQLLSLLVARLGHDQVRTPLCSADPRPLYAGRLCPITETDRTAQTPRYPKRQPVFLLPAPSGIHFNDYDWLSGPERIASGDWLQKHPFQRDYFQAWHKRHHQLHWLARHKDGRWFLEGVFS